MKFIKSITIHYEGYPLSGGETYGVRLACGSEGQGWTEAAALSVAIENAVKRYADAFQLSALAREPEDVPLLADMANGSLSVSPSGLIDLNNQNPGNW